MVFLSSNTSLYFLCPPPRGLFLVKSSPAGELSYYTKKGLRIILSPFDYFLLLLLKEVWNLN